MAVQIDRRTTEEWELILGEQVRAARILSGWDQGQLAAQAQVSVGAVKNLEGGKGSSLKTLVKVARALGRSEWLEGFSPAITVSPLQMLQAARHDQARRRVYRPRAPRSGNAS